MVQSKPCLEQKIKLKIIYINGLDNPDANYKRKIKSIKKKPMVKELHQFKFLSWIMIKMIGYINVAKNGRSYFLKGEHTEPFPIPEDMMDEVMPVKEMIDELSLIQMMIY